MEFQKLFKKPTVYTGKRKHRNEKQKPKTKMAGLHVP